MFFPWLHKDARAQVCQPSWRLPCSRWRLGVGLDITSSTFIFQMRLHKYWVFVQRLPRSLPSSSFLSPTLLSLAFSSPFHSPLHSLLLSFYLSSLFSSFPFFFYPLFFSSSLSFSSLLPPCEGGAGWTQLFSLLGELGLNTVSLQRELNGRLPRVE